MHHRIRRVLTWPGRGRRARGRQLAAEPPPPARGVDHLRCVDGQL